VWRNSSRKFHSQVRFKKYELELSNLPISNGFGTLIFWSSVLKFENIDTSEGFTEFGNSLASNRNVKQIFLARNKFPKGFPAFCTGIQGLKSNLTHLDLSQGGIPAKVRQTQNQN
jgi:hypothetical protein